METMEKVLEKLKTARKEKGFSHENMAAELGISQAAYTNIERNDTKLTVERLIKISVLLEKPTYYFFDAGLNNIFNQTVTENSIGNQAKEIYQTNKETFDRLAASYENSITNLKEEIVFLRGLLSDK